MGETGPKKYALLNLSTGEILEENVSYFMTFNEIYKVSSSEIIPINGNFSTFLLKMGIMREKKTGISNPPNLFLMLIPLILALIGHIVIGAQRAKN